MKFIDQFGYC